MEEEVAVRGKRAGMSDMVRVAGKKGGEEEEMGSVKAVCVMCVRVVVQFV
jgi:hypothetical protein